VSWDFNVELDDLAPDQAGADIPRGLKITKTFIDPNTSEALVSVSTTKEDAKENAEPEFIEEYVELARSVYVAQLERLLNYENGTREERPESDAIIFGVKLRESVDTINFLARND
jgi:hypothetical protein